MSKRVLLVSTPWERNHLVSEAIDDESHYPIGLAYLHSYLELRGHIVETEWLNNYPLIWKSVLDYKLKGTFPDIVGFNMLTMNRVSTYRGIEWIHEYYPKIQIVLGGIHATLMYQQILERYPYVIIIRGEGELTFADLLEALEMGDDYSQTPGIAYCTEGKIFKNPDRELIEDLDILPFPKHEIFFKGGRKFAGILTSRGCPSSCSFCCLNPISKKRVRFRSVAYVIQEIEYLIKTFPKLETIWIHDDSFFLNTPRVIHFCDEIVERGINISFICSGRFKPITEVLVLGLEKAGFKSVMLGLESGDEYILELCHKGIDHEDILKATKLFSQTNIDLTMFLIVGLPGENLSTILNTAKFIQELQQIKYLYYQDIGILAVYPGTEVYELMKQGGLIVDDFWMTSAATPYYTVDSDVSMLKAYKEILLSHISVDKIITPSGFLHQFNMLPWSFPYVWKYKLFPKIERYLS